MQVEVPSFHETEPQPTTRSVPDRPSAPLVPGAAMQVIRLHQRRKRSFIDLGSKNAVRRAIVASVLLGPPKALEGESDGISL